VAEIAASLVKELRTRTGAGVMDCRNALAEARGDLEKAQQLLRAKGLAAADRKSGRTAKEGVVTSYIHAGGRIGVLVEINCETDFVARTEDFRALARDVAMQIAASDPGYVSRDDIPEDVVEAERAAYAVRAEAEGGDDAAVAATVDEQMRKFYERVSLLDQPFIRDERHSVGELIKGMIARTGENIQVRRFARFRLGDG
jgi:elongation factor Ts